ncbi:MAG: hypothetical protein KDK45_23510 [Leptospiraceae bacterium]|nr:hypothetical protein [Leptospiraceae bacterium]
MKEILYDPDKDDSKEQAIKEILEYKDRILNEAFKHVFGHVPSQDEISERISGTINDNLSEEYFFDNKPLVTFKGPMVNFDNNGISVTIEPVKHYLPNQS